MDKDIIKVSMADGSEKDMEVILFYYDEQSNQNYVLYKELEGTDDCYAAKYIFNDGIYDMDTNLNKQEITKLQVLLDNMLKENR